MGFVSHIIYYHKSKHIKFKWNKFEMWHIWNITQPVRNPHRCHPNTLVLMKTQRAHLTSMADHWLVFTWWDERRIAFVVLLSPRGMIHPRYSFHCQALPFPAVVASQLPRFFSWYLNKGMFTKKNLSFDFN